ncbi:ABC-2 type transport system permease protein [Dyadobacter jejuensis]|uniref:ABC-2 type transport system permease protein n=1 Tax=Dyadobacter jejuensis TaxID=1082580 RepID=A0A316APC6_9BACT|nr:ABC transporter permease [Dyadobacter jejuensis]PWJ59338.1 ABC-2 type transport system permease protein [Dyadobacter jejuensis]
MNATIKILLVQMKAFITKEFYHVFRDRKSLLLLFGLPIAQILLFGFALTNEIKNTKIAVYDQAGDRASKRLIQRVEASKYFEVAAMLHNPAEIEGHFKSGQARLVLVIPAQFEADLARQQEPTLQIITDGSDPNTANTITNYLNNIIQDFQTDQKGNLQVRPEVRIVPVMRMLYNPQLKGAPNFVPGVMSLVLLLICVMMTSISIVREKELGTMEVLLVSPFEPILVILSKAIPYLVLSLVNLTLILVLSVVLLEMPINGSLLLLFGISTIYIITSLSLGLLISSVTDSQQAAMLLSLMGMMLPTMLFTGFMFPIENMPIPLQVISHVVPARYYYVIVKAIMIKGLGLSAIWKETAILVGMTIFLLVVSWRKFKIRLE